MTDANPQLIRGQNPEPTEGWPWFLTDYEVSYIKQYNVRPPRGGSWVATPEAEYRLEQEADGVRQQRTLAVVSTASKVTREPKRVRHNWTWITASIAMVSVGAFLAFLSVNGQDATNQLRHDTTQLHDKTSEIQSELTND